MTATKHFCKAVRNQEIADNKLLSLFESVKQTFSFAKNLQELRNKVQTLEDVIIQIMKQITECASFVRDYVQRGFHSMFEGFFEFKLRSDEQSREISWAYL